MKKILLTIMSVAILSSTINVWTIPQNVNKTVNVTNNTKKDIILQNKVEDSFSTEAQFRDIDTIEKGKTKSITFSKFTAKDYPIYYRFQKVKNK